MLNDSQYTFNHIQYYFPVSNVYRGCSHALVVLVVVLMVRYKKLDADKFSLKLNSVQNQFPILETDALKITFTLDIINLKSHLNFPCLEIIMFSAICFVVYFRFFN